MLCVLVGYPSSQVIVPASKYLTSKYLPHEDGKNVSIIYDDTQWRKYHRSHFQTTYLNYKGRIDGWASFVAGYLTALTDEYIIFALDDYLLAAPINQKIFNEYAYAQKEQVACVKLCKSTYEEHLEYPVTTQYCIWNREYLISLLQKVETPWEFEMRGSRIFESEGRKCLLATCLDYFTNSSISSRWEGVRLDGLNEIDKKYITENLL